MSTPEIGEKETGDAPANLKSIVTAWGETRNQAPRTPHCPTSHYWWLVRGYKEQIG